MNTVEAIKCLAAESILFEPGTHWNYSVCHDVLAAVAEVISGQEFRDYVKESIFEPLDMSESYYHIAHDQGKKTAQQYRRFVPERDIVKLQQTKQTEGGVIEWRSWSKRQPYTFKAYS